MSKITTATGWWKLLIDKSGGKISLLATLCEVSPRTIHRWQSGDIKRPDRDQRDSIRKVAGSLIDHPECPKYLRLKKPSAHARTPTSKK